MTFGQAWYLRRELGGKLEGRATLDAARATHLAGVRAMFLDRFTPEEQELLGGFWERVGVGGTGGPGC